MPPARNTAGLLVSLCSVNDPLGRLTTNFVPKAALCRQFLKIVLLIRMAIMIDFFSPGQLAKEKVLKLSFSHPWLRLRKDKINMLSGSKFEVAFIRFEPESHGARGNLLTIH